MLRFRPSSVIAALLLGLPLASQAAGDPAAGAEKAQTCVSCHGERGDSDNPMYPKLAGQHPSYLFQALKAYKSGQRQNQVMAGMVSGLSEQDMRDLAAFYASQADAVHPLPLGRGAK